MPRRVLLALVAHRLFGVPPKLPETVDWQAVMQESHTQTVFLMAFSHAHSLPVPSEMHPMLRSVMRKCFLRDTRIHAAHADLHRILTEAAVPYCIIKGSTSAYYYPDPSVRSMGDVDFYIDKADVARAEAALTAAGLTVVGRETVYHIAFERPSDQVHFEMHYDFNGMPEGEPARLIAEWRREIFATAQTVTTDTATFVAPDPFFHGLVMLLHMQSHLLYTGIGLRHLCDWAVFVDHFSDDAFRTVFEARLKAIGLWRCACLFSLVAHHHLGLPYREWMGNAAREREICAALLGDILSGGNFGSADPGHNRALEGQFISANAPDQIDAPLAGRVIRRLNRSVRNRWPAARKCPLLLPLGWVWLFGHHVVRVLQGRHRRIRLKENMENGQRRQDLYRELRLFMQE